MKFDPEKSLFELSAVRWIAGIALSISVISTIAIAKNAKMQFGFSSADFGLAVETFKFPLGVLAVGLSIIGIFGANHRSEQTKRQIERTSSQIELTRSQNNFANYYKHIEEFEKYCTKITNPPFSLKSTRNLYRKLFPDSRNGNFEISKEVSIVLQDAISSFLYEMNNFQNKEKFTPALIRIINIRNDFLLNFSIHQDISDNRGTEFSVEDNRHRIFETSYAKFITSHVALFNFADQIFHFDIMYKTPDNMIFLKNLDVAGYLGARINPYDPEPLDFEKVFGKDASNYVAMFAEN